MKFLNTILLLASVAMNSVHGEVKYFSKCINDRDFAITFDDGPSLDYTSKVLDVLDEFHVKATFFVNGKNCVDITENKTARDLIKREYESGHIIGSHTFTHPYGITTLTDEELTEELDDLNNALFDIIGVKPNFFRPPLGEYNEENLKIIEKSGIKANILWNLDSEDWNPSYNATEQYYKGLEGKDPFTHSFIALNHDIQKVTAETNLRIVIPYIKSLGYNIVPMDVCTGIPAYQGQDSISNEKENTDSNNNDTNANNNTDNNTNNTDNSNNTDDNNMVVDENQQSLNNNGNTSDATTIKSSILFSTIMISLIITFLI